MSLWSNILFNCAVLINLIVAFFYPFNDMVPRKMHLIYFSQFSSAYGYFSELGSSISALIWAAMLSSATLVITLPRETGIRTLVASTILRLIFSLGPEPTLWLLGTLTVLLKGIHLVSIMGNHGTLTKTYQQILTDAELVYHVAYLIFCMLGLLMHPFFYSVLVSFCTIIPCRFSNFYFSAVRCRL